MNVRAATSRRLADMLQAGLVAGSRYGRNAAGWRNLQEAATELQRRSDSGELTVQEAAYCLQMIAEGAYVADQEDHRTLN